MNLFDYFTIAIIIAWGYTITRKWLDGIAADLDARWWFRPPFACPFCAGFWLSILVVSCLPKPEAEMLWLIPFASILTPAVYKICK